MSDSQSRVNNLLAEEYEKLVDSFNQVHEKEKKSQQFKLPSSKVCILLQYKNFFDIFIHFALYYFFLFWCFLILILS